MNAAGPGPRGGADRVRRRSPLPIVSTDGIVHNFAIALDGFGTGEGQTHVAHFGHAGDRLRHWMFVTRWWRSGGSGGVDDAFVQQHDPGIGAEIMGAGKFGHRDRHVQGLPGPATSEWRPPEWCATGPVTGEASCRAATA